MRHLVYLWRKRLDRHRAVVAGIDQSRQLFNILQPIAGADQHAVSIEHRRRLECGIDDAGDVHDAEGLRHVRSALFTNSSRAEPA